MILADLFIYSLTMSSSKSALDDASWTTAFSNCSWPMFLCSKFPGISCLSNIHINASKSDASGLDFLICSKDICQVAVTACCELWSRRRSRTSVVWRTAAIDSRFPNHLRYVEMVTLGNLIRIYKLCSVRNCMSDLIVNLWKSSGINIL